MAYQGLNDLLKFKLSSDEISEATVIGGDSRLSVSETIRMLFTEANDPLLSVKEELIAVSENVSEGREVFDPLVADGVLEMNFTTQMSLRKGQTKPPYHDGSSDFGRLEICGVASKIEPKESVDFSSPIMVC